MNLNRERLAGLLARPALLIAPVVAAFALFLIPAVRVSAHAAYDHSTPGDGEVLAAAPARIDVFFKEETQRANGLPTLVVVNGSGDTVSSNTTLDDNDRKHISADLNPGLPPGRYAVIWHNVSADDGDEAQGAFYFYVGTGPSPSASGSTGTTTATPGAATPTVKPGTTESDDSGDIPTWGLIAGIIAGLVVGAGGGIAIGRRAGS
jgi:methionine-rich copper-binding protein CopC